MLASEMSKLSSQSRDNDKGFEKQWTEMQDRIRATAKEGKNYCPMVYGSYNDQLIEKLKEEGFKVAPKMEIFSWVHYGMANCMTKYVIW